MTQTCHGSAAASCAALGSDTDGDGDGCQSLAGMDLGLLLSGTFLSADALESVLQASTCPLARGFSACLGPPAQRGAG